MAVVPALLVMEEYLDRHPNSLVHHYRVNASTSELIHNVLGEGRWHELGSALIVIASALVFGIGARPPSRHWLALAGPDSGRCSSSLCRGY